MGRRKIEIQPITHERNRSVTFLKRKNGLFKKAYELGVLCSVDVAVIIFEDRPGHDLKLHQYSSSDIREIVQRQLRHQGEKDIKGPGDFSGAGGAKFDDNGDGDDDALEDEEDDLPVRSKKRRSAPKLSLPQDADGDSDYSPSSHRNGNSVPHLPPPPMHSSSRLDSASGVGSMLPVSNDRVSSIRDSHTRTSKRPRSTLDSMDPGRRSPGSDMMGSRPPELYLPDSQPGRFNRQIRHSHNMPPPSHPYHHPEQMQHPAQNFNPNYTPLFPVANQASPPPSFIPLHADFVPSSRNHPSAPSSFVRDMGPQQNSSYSGTSRTRFNNEPQYDPALYPGAIRQQPQQTPTSQFPIHSPMHREERVDMFDAFLEAERSRQQGIVQPRSGPGGGLEWPNHEGPPSPPRVVEPLARGSGSMDVSSAPVVPQIPHDSNGGDSWFDMFSGTNANAGGISHARSPRQGTSWERGATGPGGSGGGPSGGTSGGTSAMGARDDLAASFNSAVVDKPGGRASDVRSSREGGQPSDGKANSGRGSKGASPTQTPDIVMQPPENTTPARRDDASTGVAPKSGEEKSDTASGKRTPEANAANGTAKDGPASDIDV